MGKVFTQVLVICDRQGLIGRQMFAIDGVKLPSNASKAKSGKRKDFVRQATKMEQAVEKSSADPQADAATAETQPSQREQRQIERLSREAKQIHEWLEHHRRERQSAKGRVRLSNRTDNESAKMATGKGVVQGYTGVAAVDDKHQIVVEAQAHGSGSEQELLWPVCQRRSNFPQNRRSKFPQFLRSGDQPVWIRCAPFADARDVPWTACLGRGRWSGYASACARGAAERARAADSWNLRSV